MPDRLTPEARSAHMRLIRKTDTGPELAVRRAAHRLGYRFRLHRRDLPGTPDLVFPKLRKAILVHGCFWHQHAGCRLARLPRSRPEYWLPKLRRNQQRDAAAYEALDRLGWQVLVIWECEAASDDTIEESVRTFLQAA
ncbi:very short patch repair endonuclease [Bradyrhizobium sp. LHD-71]|uniref:very short patch repair endonuclease n=1 Tax=Bradyrhizobium sp. LHD-71 TaxID=3072141 RepID=UPI00280F623D|nr:very short patch repair endonuclease [Bradyrhizobium sp. LHD-71]MDQ8727392.1 very short patch repair endonuclease [Bradyrhizobium sp. LHD-71]